MATRLEEILTRSRDTLSDPLQERWSDARLLRLADDAQKSIVLFANYIKTKVTIQILAGVEEYTFTDIVHKLTRVLNENSDVIPLLSHEQADTLFGLGWELITGSPVEAIIFDKLNSNILKVYPIPVTADPTTLTPSTPVYGVTTSGDVQVDSLSSPYGVVTGFEVQSVTTLLISVLTNPLEVNDVNDTLQVNPVFDKAIKFYITGMALRDSKDIQDKQVGNEELGFYQLELRQAMKASASNFTASRTQYEVPYSRAI